MRDQGTANDVAAVAHGHAKEVDDLHGRRHLLVVQNEIEHHGDDVEHHGVDFADSVDHGRLLQVPQHIDCSRTHTRDVERGKVLALNPTAAAVWDLLDGTRGPAALAAVLCEATDATPAQATADVEALLDQLRSEGFLAPDA